MDASLYDKQQSTMPLMEGSIALHSRRLKIRYYAHASPLRRHRTTIHQAMLCSASSISRSRASSSTKIKDGSKKKGRKGQRGNDTV